MWDGKLYVFERIVKDSKNSEHPRCEKKKKKKLKTHYTHIEVINLFTYLY